MGFRRIADLASRQRLGAIRLRQRPPGARPPDRGGDPRRLYGLPERRPAPDAGLVHHLPAASGRCECPSGQGRGAFRRSRPGARLGGRGAETELLPGRCIARPRAMRPAAAEKFAWSPSSVAPHSAFKGGRDPQNWDWRSSPAAPSLLASPGFAEAAPAADARAHAEAPQRRRCFGAARRGAGADS